MRGVHVPAIRKGGNKGPNHIGEICFDSECNRTLGTVGVTQEFPASDTQKVRTDWVDDCVEAVESIAP